MDLQNKGDIDEPLQSWTDTIKEPQLEYDDNEFNLLDLSGENIDSLVIEDEVLDKGSDVAFFGENYDELLDQIIQPNDEASLFSDIKKYNIVTVSGDDAYGRKIISINACNLPDKQKINYNTFLQYILHTLDAFVELDYVIVYFHHGLTSKNKPSIAWLWQAYKIFDRKYKKNLKQIYLVHPTNLIKAIYQIFKSTLSHKFGNKITYVNYLIELQKHMSLDQIYIPQFVLEYDNKLYLRDKEKLTSIIPNLPSLEKNATPIFGIPLDNYDKIPPILEDIIEKHLRNDKTLQIPGLFRRCPNAQKLHSVKQALNLGHTLQNDPDIDAHTWATLLKFYFKSLPVCIMGSENYDIIVQKDIDDQSSTFCRQIVNELPNINYQTLKYLISFLKEVTNHETHNHMNAKNLSIVFGPNLIWSNSQQNTIESIHRINNFVGILITDYDFIFENDS